MSRAHSVHTIEEKAQEQAKLRLQLRGGNKAPHAFSGEEDTSLDSMADDVKVTNAATATLKRIKQAKHRDARFGIAGYVWHRKHGLSQALRETYDSSRQLSNGGILK